MRLLIAEDDLTVRRLVTESLEQLGVTVTAAGTAAAALNELQHATFDVAIFDKNLPDGSGLDLLRAVRELGSPTHVIFLTGAGSETDRVEALELGADDYVVKPFFVRELTARVLAVRRRQDVAKETTLQYGPIAIDLDARQVTVNDAPLLLTAKEFDLLAFMAARPGHAFSRDELLRSVWRSAADWQQAATVTEHMRRLRSKIEEDPHEPRVLQTVRGVGYRFEPPPSDPSDQGSIDSPDASARLRHLVTGVTSEVSDAVIVTDPHLHVRSWNKAAEHLYGWAEDEVLGRHLFDVVPFADESDQLSAAVRTLEEKGRWFGEGQQIARDGSLIAVSASTTLVRDESGELVVVVSVNRPAADPLRIAERPPVGIEEEAAIRSGIDRGEFEVHYQPVVTFDDLRIASVEALVRWNHPVRGLLTPNSFIDAAERTGLIVELGRAVFDKACRQTAEWRSAGFDLQVAVNLSSRQLGDPALFDDITTTLATTGLDPHALWLEVTETALVEDAEQAAALLHRLAALGIRMAIDDFGTGWASLTYLKLFPIHALKIDQTFVDGVTHNPQDAAIARSIISLGDELDLIVVAEGIETEAQQAALQELGCSVGQGFLYGRPTPAAALPMQRARRL